MMYTDNPIRDAEAYTQRQEAWLNRRPICCECGDHIQDDTLFLIADKIYCEKCMRREFERDIDDEGEY